MTTSKVKEIFRNVIDTAKACQIAILEMDELDDYIDANEKKLNEDPEIVSMLKEFNELNLNI